ncbi:MAG: hypothetical protein H0U74_06135 [Bradymonadaceae bacterium]|nr:hypothetical protein [Lujinxingiaceae bacterium]
MIALILLSVGAAGFNLGCKADEFADAPSVKAPPSDSKAGPLAPGQGLPPNHPPIGDAQSDRVGIPSAGSAAGAPDRDPANYGKSGPILWQAPSGWLAVAPGNEMRLGQYNVPGPDGEEPGELTIFYFGPGGGGGVDANLERWAAQLSGGEPAKRDTRTVNAMVVHTVDASGKFDAGMAMGGGAPKDNQRVLGAIAETSAGLYFFKLVGPIATLEQNEEAFEQFVASFRAGG